MKKLIILLLAVFVSVAGLNAQSRKKLHDPAADGDLATVKKVIEKYGEVDKRDIAGQTPLMWAAGPGRIEVVKYLIEKGADVNATSGPYGRGTALIYAASSNQLEVMRYLLENKADIDATTISQHETALFWAVAFGQTEAVMLLLEKGANKNIMNKKGQKAIDVAKDLKKDSMVKLLEN